MDMMFDFEPPTEKVQPVVAEEKALVPSSAVALEPTNSYEQFLKYRDEYISAVRDAVLKIKKVSVAATVRDPSIMDGVTETEAVVIRFQKALLAQADLLKQPHQKVVNETNREIKPIKDAVDDTRRACRQLYGQHRKASQLEEEKRRREAEEADRRLQASLKKEAEKIAKETGKDVEVPELPKTVVERKQVIRTESGAATHFRKDIKVEVVNIRTLCLACLDPKDKRIDMEIEDRVLIHADEKLLKDLYKAGRRDIPGVKFTDIEIPITRT